MMPDWWEKWARICDELVKDPKKANWLKDSKYFADLAKLFGKDIDTVMRDALAYLLSLKADGKHKYRSARRFMRHQFERERPGETAVVKLDRRPHDAQLEADTRRIAAENAARAAKPRASQDTVDRIKADLHAKLGGPPSVSGQATLMPETAPPRPEATDRHFLRIAGSPGFDRLLAVAQRNWDAKWGKPEDTSGR